MAEGLCLNCGHVHPAVGMTTSVGAKLQRLNKCQMAECGCCAFEDRESRLVQAYDAALEKSVVDHPSYYGGKDNIYEAIKVIEAWGLGFNVGNCVKYLSRAGKKDPKKLVEDLDKAKWYLTRALENAKAGKPL